MKTNLIVNGKSGPLFVVSKTEGLFYPYEEYALLEYEVDDWFDDLSPWKMKDPFKNKYYLGNGKKTLSDLLQQIDQISNFEITKIVFVGYSLAGLFSCWAAFETDRIDEVVSCSGSLWCEGFVDYVKTGSTNAKKVYLSLGDSEAKTKNKIFSTVESCTIQIQKLLIEKGIRCIFEMNEGNHFQDPSGRVQKGINWIKQED